MAFKIIKAHAYPQNDIIRKGVYIRLPNGMRTDRSAKTIPELDAKIHKEFGLKLTSEDIKKIEQHVIALEAYGGKREEKKYKTMR